jgi:hypothetical protein
VSAVSFVIRHGKHRRHVRRNVLQRRADRTPWVRAGQEAAELGSPKAARHEFIPLPAVQARFCVFTTPVATMRTRPTSPGWRGCSVARGQRMKAVAARLLGSNPGGE